MSFSHEFPMPSQRGCLVAAVSVTRKSPSPNQDAYGKLCDAAGHSIGVVIADGVGSHYGGADASRTVVAAFQEFTNEFQSDSTEPVDLKGLFLRAQKSLIKEVDQLKQQQDVPDQLDLSRAYSTTAIAMIEEEVAIQAGFVGNGAILQLRGDFDEHPPGRLLPASVNLLNPHCMWENGRSILYRFLGASAQNRTSEPSIVALTKDEAVGDIMIALTDGIYSLDEVLIGRDHRGDIFIEARQAVVLLYEALTVFFQGPLTERALEIRLESYLDILLEHNLVDDDATVAVLISARALAYRQQQQEARSTKGANADSADHQLAEHELARRA